MINKWKTISTEVVYKTPYNCRLTKNKVIKPDGKTGNWFVLKRSDLAVIIAQDENGDIYLIGQYRYAVKSYSWEFPMGVSDDKLLINTAKRELKEEAGCDAKTWVNLGKFFVAPGIMNQKAHVYLAKDLTVGKNHPETSEFLQIKKCSFKEIKDMIDNQKILDGLTICAFRLFEVYLNRTIKV